MYLSAEKPNEPAPAPDPAPPRKPFAWSFTAMTQFTTCPRQYYLMRVAKLVKDTDSPASMWGKRVHDALNKYISSRTPLPATMMQFQPMADKILARPGKRYPEMQMALDASYAPTSWFARNTWVRGIMDVGLKNPETGRMFIGDWKTGKYKPENVQLKLFAAMGFSHFPGVDTIVTAFLWLKTGQVTTERFERAQVPELWQTFLPVVARMENALERNNFPPRPSGLCRSYCPVGRQHCEHCGS